jgi:hypothetical protein
MPLVVKGPVRKDDDDEWIRFELSERGLLTIARCITFLIALLIASAAAVGVAGRLAPECPMEKK